MGELNFYGIYIPIFLIQAILAYMVLKVVNIGTDQLVEKGWIALPSIFNLCVYILLLWSMHALFLVFWA